MAQPQQRPGHPEQPPQADLAFPLPHCYRQLLEDARGRRGDPPAAALVASYRYGATPDGGAAPTPAALSGPDLHPHRSTAGGLSDPLWWAEEAEQLCGSSTASCSTTNFRARETLRIY
jgi:hypothetical protein